MRVGIVLLCLLLAATPVHAALFQGVVTNDRAQQFIVDEQVFRVHLLLAGEGSETARAILAINGQPTGIVEEGDTIQYGGASLRIQEVLVRSSGGLVRFYLSFPGSSRSTSGSPNGD